MGGRYNPRIPALELEEDISYFENKSGLVEDMKFLACIPEMCDVTFLVGAAMEPVCAVKAILAVRSKVFYQQLYLQPSVKKEPLKENKFRSIIKRKSDSSIGAGSSSTAWVESTSDLLLGREIIRVTEFEPDIFRQIIEYIHTGNVILQPRTLLGVMSGADKYALDELRKSCSMFVKNCITVDTVCALLQSADRYVHYKSTKNFLQQVLKFVDKRGNEVLNLGSFTLLPLHVVRLVLARKELAADEFTKFQAALMWTMKYSDLHKEVDWKVMFRENFLTMIKYHKIPATVLMKEVDPLKVIPNNIIMAALAYQADPTCVKPEELITGIKMSDSDSNHSDIDDKAGDVDELVSSHDSLDTFQDSLLDALPYDEPSK